MRVVKPDAEEVGLVLFGPKVYSFVPKHHSLSDERRCMAKKLLTLLFTSLFVFSLSAPIFAQDAAKPAKAAKQGRWEGIITRSSKDKSTLTVRSRSSNVEKTVMYDSATKWTSQEHHSKKVNDIDVTQVNDNDRVICLGTWDKDGVLHATMISKRLTN
jgi:hypothetical protein